MGKKNKRKMADESTCAATVDSHGTEEGADQAEGVAVTPHKKHKSKKEDQDISEDPAENSLCVDGQKKKKKRKADSKDVVEEDSKPSKVKKPKLEKDIGEKCSKLESTGECSTEVVEVATNENCSKEQKKKKKKKAQGSGEDDTAVTVSRENIVSGPQVEVKTAGDNDTEPREVKKKHKKDKKKSKHVEESTNGVEALAESQPQDNAIDGSLKKKKSKEHKNKDIEENLIDSSAVEDVSIHKEKKKKKHKKDKSELKSDESQNRSANGVQENGTEMKTEKKKEKTDKLKKVKSEENGAAEDKDSAEEMKQKKKDKKHKKKEKSEQSINPMELTTSKEQDSTEIIRAKKESKKKKKTETVEESKCDTETVDIDPKDHDVKQKKKERKSKDKKNKAEQDVAGDGHDICSKTVDQKQTTTTCSEPETNTDPDSAEMHTVGQWSTNMFKNKKRENKFIRLLGSFKKAGDTSSAPTGPKKGLFGSLQLQREPSSGGQRALTYDAAQAMHKRLESDYERALAFSARGQRGTGLGFTPDPAEGKKFHIDANSCFKKV